MVVAASMETVLAVVRPATAAPRLPPPMVIVPPPVLPLASSTAPVSAIWLPPTAIDPPLPPLPETSSVPETVVVPSAPPSTKALPSMWAELAARPAGRCTVSRTAPTTAEVRIRALPPATTGPPGTTTCMKPSPLKSSVAASPEFSAILPSGTAIVPEVLTSPPSKAANPPRATRIDPAFDTAPPLPLKASLPAMKSLSAISSVEATKPPPRSTVPVAVMTMPLGLIRKT